MSFIQIIVLALVQGITEFLPISSSGHLILGSWLFDWPDQGLVFDMAVHVGTLAAVITYFRREWIQLFFGIGRNQLVEVDDSGGVIRARSLALLILLGTVPLAIGGLLMKESIETNFRTPEAVGWSLLVTAVVLLVGELLGRRNRVLSALRLPDSVIIGFAQMLSVLPGISRSGVTISIALMMGVQHEKAANFAFFMAIPVLLGAGLLQLFTIDCHANISCTPLFVGFISSAVTGYLVINWLLGVILRGKFYLFSLYCVTMPIIAYIFIN